MPRQRGPPGPRQSHGQAPCCAGTGDTPSRGPGAVEGRRATRGPSPGGTGVPGCWIAPRMHIRSHVQTTWSTHSHLHMHTRLYTHHTLTHHTLTPRTLAHARSPAHLASRSSPRAPPSAASEPGAGEPELPLLTSQRRDSLTAEAPASRPPGSAARGALAQGWVALGGVWPPHALAFAPGGLAELKGTGAVLSASWKGNGGRGHPPPASPPPERPECGPGGLAGAPQITCTSELSKRAPEEAGLG